MRITDRAKNLLEDILNEKGAVGIRLASVEGCCGPQFAISLEAPEKSDTLKIINGINVAIDSQVNGIEGLTLDKEEYSEGPGFVLLGANRCC